VSEGVSQLKVLTKMHTGKEKPGEGLTLTLNPDGVKPTYE